MTFDIESLELLRDAYDEAIDLDKDSFIFAGQFVYVGYAKYLLEYLDTKLA